MRRCKENPSKRFGHYCCGNGVTINGIRFCSEYGIQAQIDYAGHTFCDNLGEEYDENQLTIELQGEKEMKKVKPLPRPCVICKNRKPRTPIKIRDDNGTLFECSFIAHCPYCGRFLEEDYDTTEEE